MKTRPINFKAHEVRAIREGRKTQTRRIIKPQPSETHWDIIPGYKLLVNGPHNLSCGRLGWRFQHCIPQNPVGDKPTWAVCPFGKPGDRLWVRETWGMSFEDIVPTGRQFVSGGTWGSPARPNRKPCVVFRADGDMPDDSPGETATWCPSIHMPRWVSRITLEIVSVRVERLRDIKNEDCWKEGMCDATNPELKANRKWFSELWESINGHGSWDLNPWVWVVEFKEVKP